MQISVLKKIKNHNIYSKQYHHDKTSELVNSLLSFFQFTSSEFIPIKFR